MLRSYRRALAGNSASVGYQQSATGRMGKGLATPQSAPIVGKGTSPRRSSVPLTKHTYHQDEDRMICEHCGFWYAL